MSNEWLFFQLAPLIKLGLPKLLNFFEDLLLHTFPLRAFLVKSDYNKLYNAFMGPWLLFWTKLSKVGLKEMKLVII